MSIQAHENAIEGSVLRPATNSRELLLPGSAVLCRNVAPLVSFAISLLHRRIPCRILGSDIAKQLTSLVEKQKASDLDVLETRLRAWLQKVLEKSSNPDPLIDQHDCLMAFIAWEKYEKTSTATVTSLLSRISHLFGGIEGAARLLLLSTIHKAKGLEWPTVFLLDRQRIPSKYATHPWQLVQEQNLLYVAVTRAIETLVYISSDCWEQ